MALPKLKHIDLPEFGEPRTQPVIPRSTYDTRVEAALERGGAARWDALVVYADREHFANVAHLTGYDPRFEEATLVLVPGRTPSLIVGNEGWGYADLAGGRFEKVLWASFSLISQPRVRVRRLTEILSSAGVEAGMRVGLVGWKYFGPEDGVPVGSIDMPVFVAEAVEATIGATGTAGNATDLFMNPRDGLRVISDVDQLAQFEFAAAMASQSLRRVLLGLQPGMSEIDAARLMQLPGLPVSAHPMLSSGTRAAVGLASPTLKPIALGDAFTMALGFWGGLSARAGFVVADAADLPTKINDYVDRLVVPYFAALASWYETLHIGVAGHDLYRAVHEKIGDPFFGVHLNPGHHIHLDEWVSSPIFAGSDTPIASGMALQSDIIPATGGDYFTTNAEDGVAIADADLRELLAAKYPSAWSRIQQRRRFMTETLGINLRPEVLSLSNIPAYLQPFMLSPGTAMVCV